MNTDDERNLRRIEPKLPGGFRDTPPDMTRAKRRVLDAARRTFESFGFEEMATPAVERTEVLTGGEEESGKIIFTVRGSQEDPMAEASMSLRFDLTVPLARFLAANPDIPKPFKRFQIGEVWRGESPQAGRYREFTQADVDIIGTRAVEADAEVIAVMCQLLNNIGVKDFLIKINNRKILEVLPAYAGFPASRQWEALRIVDKKDKIGEAGVREELTQMFSSDVADKIITFLNTEIEELRKRLLADADNPSVAEGTKEIRELLENLDALGVDTMNRTIDLSLARGLAYYTGPVFETVLSGASELGSIASGGRYDNLMTPFTGQRIPAVGISLGVDRLLVAREKLGNLPKNETATTVLMFNLVPELKNEYLAMASELRSAGVNVSLYLGEDRAFQAQLAYAVKKGLPFIVIYGEEEAKQGIVAIKNLRTRTQDTIPRANLTRYFQTTFK